MSGYVGEREVGESRCWMDKARQSQKEGKEKSSYERNQVSESLHCCHMREKLHSSN